MMITCKITFKKQLLPRFCNPGTNQKLSEGVLLVSEEDQVKVARFFILPSLRAKNKPATPSRLATDRLNPEAETNWGFDKIAAKPCLNW